MVLRQLGILLGVAGFVAVAGAAPDPAARCAADKVRAVKQAAAAKLACHAVAATRRTEVDGGCLARAERKLAASFARADARGGCRAVGDQPLVESRLDACVTDVVTTIRSGTVESSTTVVTTTTLGVTTTQPACGALGCFGSCPLPNHQCIAIPADCNGQPVPCGCHDPTTTCPPTTLTTTTLP